MNITKDTIGQTLELGNFATSFRRASKKRIIHKLGIGLSAWLFAAFAPVTWAATDVKGDGKPPGDAPVPGANPTIPPPAPSNQPSRPPRVSVPGGVPGMRPQPPAPPLTGPARFYDLIGSSDAVVLVEVTEVADGPTIVPSGMPARATPSTSKSSPAPVAPGTRAIPTPGFRGRPAASSKVLSLKIVKQLKGKVDVTTLGAFQTGEFAPGQRYIIGLTEYSLRSLKRWVNDSTVWFEGKDEAEIAEAIKTFPLEVTLIPPAEEIPVNMAMEWKVKVRNTGQKDLTIDIQDIDGLLTTEEGYGYDRPNSMMNQFATRVVKAGEETTFSQNKSLAGPYNWTHFSSNTWPLAYKVFARLYFSEVASPGDSSSPGRTVLRRFPAKSAWAVLKVVPPPGTPPRPAPPIAVAGKSSSGSSRSNGGNSGSSPAPTGPDRFFDLIGKSDAVVLVEVTEVTDAPAPLSSNSSARSSGQSTPQFNNLSLKIVKQLKGKVGVTTLKATGTGEFAPGQRYIIGLDHFTGDAWRLSFSANARTWFGGEDEADVIEAIKAFPLHVSLIPPTEEVPVDTAVEWKVKVRNTGQKNLDVSIHGISFDLDVAGYVYLGRPGFGGRPSGTSNNGDWSNASKTIKAGEDAVLSVKDGLCPTNWKLFGPKAWPLVGRAQARITVGGLSDGSSGSTSVSSFGGRISPSAVSEWIPLKAVPAPNK